MCQQVAPQRAMPQDVWTPMITSDHSLRNKTCDLATKSHMLNFCEAYAAICCDCDLQKPTTQDKKRFPVLQKKRTKPKITTTFGKSLFLIKCKKLKRISVLRKKRAKPKQKNNDGIRKVFISDKMQETKKNFCPPKKTSKAKKK